MDLYDVTTCATKYSDYKDVTFSWFRTDGAPGSRPYASLIENYDPGSENAIYAEGAVDELFTADGAAALKDSMAAGDFPVGGLTDFYMLDKAGNYSLPFRVWGYFDLRGCEQTNDEARTTSSFPF